MRKGPTDTTKPANSGRSSSCAAGTADPDGYETVLRLARAHAFCRPPCLRVQLREKRLIIAATANAVKIEKLDCHQIPPPFYCTSGGNFGSGPVGEWLLHNSTSPGTSRMTPP